MGGCRSFVLNPLTHLEKSCRGPQKLPAVFSVIYVSLTMACAVAYVLAGMGAFDATVHAMTTIATGGFSNYDSSFAAFGPGASYVATVSCYWLHCLS